VELFSRVNATGNVSNYGTIPIGALLAGGLASALGVREAMWIMTALLPVSSLFLLASPLRRLRILPDAAPPPTGSVQSWST